MSHHPPITSRPHSSLPNLFIFSPPSNRCMCSLGVVPSRRHLLLPSGGRQGRQIAYISRDITWYTVTDTTKAKVSDPTTDNRAHFQLVSLAMVTTVIIQGV